MGHEQKTYDIAYSEPNHRSFFASLYMFKLTMKTTEYKMLHM